MKYRTKYICPECEVEPLYIKINMLPKELMAGSLSGLNITKEMMVNSLKRNDGAISKDTIEKERLADKFDSVYCVYCQKSFSFSMIVRSHI